MPMMTQAPLPWFEVRIHRRCVSVEPMTFFDARMVPVIHSLLPAADGWSHHENGAARFVPDFDAAQKLAIDVKQRLELGSVAA